MLTILCNSWRWAVAIFIIGIGIFINGLTPALAYPLESHNQKKIDSIVVDLIQGIKRFPLMKNYYNRDDYRPIVYISTKMISENPANVENIDKLQINGMLFSEIIRRSRGKFRLIGGVSDETFGGVSPLYNEMQSRSGESENHYKYLEEFRKKSLGIDIFIQGFLTSGYDGIYIYYQAFDLKSTEILAVTSPQKIKFNKNKSWKNRSVLKSIESPKKIRHLSNLSKKISLMQRDLKFLGYYTGPENGIFNQGTKKAVRAFGRDANLAPTDNISERLLREIRREVVLHRGSLF